MAEFPNRARVVIIGQGGIVGACVVHHLLERGWEDIVGLDKSGIPTDVGSTAHASDFCYATAHDQLTCWSTLYSIDFYEKLGHYARALEQSPDDPETRILMARAHLALGEAVSARQQLEQALELVTAAALDMLMEAPDRARRGATRCGRP